MKKFKKKLLSLALVMGLVASCFTACGEDKKEETKKNEDTKKYEDQYTSMNAIEFTEVMGNGINLSNTMEAWGYQSYGINAATSVYETSWGAPVTTAEMIQGMKDAGFDSIRIPVAWTNMMDFEKGDYTINKAYIERVREIIQYAVDADMIAVVNDHWDGGWWAMFSSSSEETRKAAMELYTSMWTQITEAYKDFDSHLVFESGNEEMGNRFNDKEGNKYPWQKDTGNLTEDECYELTNTLNQKFVDIVRAAGGYNANRFLLIAGYNTNIANTCDDRYKMPTDKVDGKLIVSVHYYDPSAYCIDEGIASWGTQSDVQTMNDNLAKLTKFTDAGYGVIIGEWGVLEGKKTKGLKEDTLDYIKNFIANCEYYGYCPMLWDQNFLYSRSECKIVYEEIATFFAEKSYSKVQKDVDKEEVVGLAKRYISEALKNAPTGEQVPDDEARAWIMFNSGDWSIAYRVGDDYPDGEAAGIEATDVKIEGAGTYTVALDFTGTANGKATNIAFAALGILHGEDLYPNYCIEVKEVRVNGVAIETGRFFTTSDDGSCTRANIYNAWVTDLPDEARTADGDLTGCTPTPVAGDTIGDIETLEIEFEYIAP